MKTIIIYATKTGTTEKCANLIGKYIDHADTIAVSQMRNIDVSTYDQIILGSYIRMGMIDKIMKKFILKNKECLKEKDTSIFICCGFNENREQYFKNNIPNDLLEKLVNYDTFGGELDVSKQRGISKLIVSMVSKENPNKKIELQKENIKRFGEQLKNREKLKD